MYSFITTVVIEVTLDEVVTGKPESAGLRDIRFKVFSIGHHKPIKQFQFLVSKKGGTSLQYAKTLENQGKGVSFLY